MGDARPALLHQLRRARSGRVCFGDKCLNSLGTWSLGGWPHFNVEHDSRWIEIAHQNHQIVYAYLQTDQTDRSTRINSLYIYTLTLGPAFGPMYAHVRLHSITLCVFICFWTAKFSLSFGQTVRSTWNLGCGHHNLYASHIKFLPPKNNFSWCYSSKVSIYPQSHPIDSNHRCFAAKSTSNPIFWYLPFLFDSRKWAAPPSGSRKLR